MFTWRNLTPAPNLNPRPDLNPNPNLKRVTPLIRYHRVRPKLYGGPQSRHSGVRLTVHRLLHEGLLGLTRSRDVSDVTNMGGLFVDAKYKRFVLIIE